MTFLNRLRHAHPERLALATESARLSFADLVGQAEKLRADIGDAAGMRVFLNLSDPVAAIVAMAALDGVAGAIVLSSPSLDADMVRTLAARASADAILSARDDLGGDIPVVAHAADLAGVAHSGASGETTDWVMTTSGTTGQPKLVIHGLDTLTRTTKTDQTRGRGQVWGLLYDFTRFAGLQVVLQALMSGATLVVPSDALPLDQRIAVLTGAGVTHLSATPTFWRKIMMTPGVDAMPLRQITLGGEIADDAVLTALSRRWPDARVSHIFASTEAGVGFSVTDGRAGFPKSYLDHPPQGIAIKVEDDHLFIRNERAATHYLGGDGEIAQDGWVGTGDLVRIDGDRVLFLGRGSGVINVGGDKVHPEEVEAMILTHPAVHMARVYARKNPIVGALVAADVVLNEPGDAAAFRAQLTDWLQQRMDRYKVPAMIRVVEGFDLNAAGKLKRS